MTAPNAAEDELTSALFTLKCYRGEVAIDHKRPNDLLEIDQAIIKLESAIKKASELVEIGEMRESGVIWHKQNPHAHPLGTKFYALKDI